jgi:aminoglycoside 6'-N-acetyltransferase I
LGAYRNEHLVGCIGATAQYGGHAWELHPLAVAPRHARKGVGTALIQSLCNSLLERGACTLFAWCDDETASTSLGGVDVYPDPLIAVSTLVSGPRHAGGFYLKNHFRLTGILPDANGFGKPDLLYVRRIAPVI